MDGGSGYSSVDKSRVLDVKPLRSLVPVFPSTLQAPSFVGQSTSGFSPFYPFTSPQGTPSTPDLNQQIPPAPIRSFPGEQQPHLSDVTNGGTRPHPKKSRSQNRYNSLYVADSGNGTSSDFVVGISLVDRHDGNREVVNNVLVRFDALRRRLSQIEDAKESRTGIIRRVDLKAGNILMSNGVRTNMRKRVGVAPGVEIGDIFFFRMEMCLVGLHSQSMAGIDYMIVQGDFEEQPVALSIVSSVEYDDDVEDSDVLIYSGHGGNANNKDKKAADQKLERGNLALERTLHWANEVRVIRGIKDNLKGKVYVYDGLYKILESWIEKGRSGCNMFKYKLVRMPGQPGAFAVWKSIQKWKEGFSSRAGLILPDLTSGSESIPVALVNDVDDERGPAHFNYFPTIKYVKSFKLVKPYFGCNCRNACLPGDPNCSCIQKNGGYIPYTANGVLVGRKPLIHECGPTCPCFPNCKNRVSQTGFKLRLEVFKTKNRGWGLRSWDPIRAGTFICEFAGEVLDKLRKDREEENDDYIFDTTRVYESFKWNYEPGVIEEDSSHDSTEEYNVAFPLIISAKNVGNVARFMNHSCSPNVFWQPVMYEHNTESFVHIAFFAMRHVPPLTELTYDYGMSCTYESEGNNAPSKKKNCLCGSPKCRGYFG
ncbi:SET domain-containing protein/YDG_SRA domain-containing protein/Pre-SET domain-containing protein [Cephalotus follicularis]|uniref:SET domain-containing protein/YDG_SRA domain-containing protein/Pre-SET domain-containing protein n=1 Tax=Cephalotus follicularis TaxID=3775 RepID=A0A1Q3CID8_CEPFO|nr:SET domain-containing protein/YDG_SRA domain-containing protein/Pre-SET domain-containing protein [Cephalotus follicularis]